MNKLLLSEIDEEINLVIDNDTELIINDDYLKKNLNVIVEDDICLHVIEITSFSSNHFAFSLKENSRLIYDKVGSNINDKIIINLDGILSSVEIRNSVTSNEDSSCYFIIRHNASKTVSSIINHGANLSANKLNFNVDVYIALNALGCVTDQKNMIINMTCGKSVILPNLIIDVDDVVANHSAFIGYFDKNVIFYLKTRGINAMSAKNLLMNGFLLGNVNTQNEYEDRVKKILKF